MLKVIRCMLCETIATKRIRSAMAEMLACDLRPSPDSTLEKHRECPPVLTFVNRNTDRLVHAK